MDRHDAIAKPPELVTRAFGIEIGADTDMRALFADPGALARLEEAIAPDAVVEFATPDGGFVGDMGGPFRGLDGLREGWAEWLAPWESFTFHAADIADAGEGRVLLLGETHARLASGVEVEAHVGAAYTIRDGRIVLIQHFLDQDQARRAVGLA